MSAVYSPSSTTAWKRCPLKWALDQQGIASRLVGKRDLGAALGSAFAAAMHIYQRCRQVGVDWGEGPVQAALGNLITTVQGWEVDGRLVAESDQSQAASLGRRVEALVRYALAHDPLPDDWTPIAVEEPLPDAGNARPDVVLRKGNGELVVVDYKTTLTLGTKAADRQRKLQYRVDDWRDSDQLYHYAWAVGQRYQEPVTHTAIVLAEVEPKPQLTMHDFWIDPDALVTWLDQQQQAWALMNEHRRVPGLAWRAGTHSDTFGRCEYYDFCYGATISRAVDYVTRTRRD